MDSAIVQTESHIAELTERVHRPTKTLDIVDQRQQVCCFVMHRLLKLDVVVEYNLAFQSCKRKSSKELFKLSLCVSWTGSIFSTPLPSRIPSGITLRGWCSWSRTSCSCRRTLHSGSSARRSMRQTWWFSMSAVKQNRLSNPKMFVGCFYGMPTIFFFHLYSGVREGNRMWAECALHLRQYNDALLLNDTLRMVDAFRSLDAFYQPKFNKAIDKTDEFLLALFQGMNSGGKGSTWGFPSISPLDKNILVSFTQRTRPSSGQWHRTLATRTPRWTN